nr:hypothetical protein [Tanacetum cinerariifolium]
MATNDKESSVAGTDNRPPMLEESDFESWKICIERYIHGKPLGKLIWKSIKNRPTPHLTIIVITGEGKQQTQVDLYTHLKSYEQHAMKTLSKMNQTSRNADSLAYMDQETQSTSSASQYVPLPPQYAPAPQQAPQSTSDAMLECKEKKRAKDSQWFKDKALLMEAKEKGAILDAEAEAFLADVECTAPYAEPLAITTAIEF